MHCCMQHSVQMTHAPSVNILVAWQMMEKQLSLYKIKYVCQQLFVSIVCMAVSFQNDFQGTHFSIIIREDSYIYTETSLGFDPSSLNSCVHRYTALLCQFLTAAMW